LIHDCASEFQGPSAVPSLKNLSGVKMVYVKNYGCTANKFDFEVMLAHLMSAGYRLTYSAASADVILINTCAVKKPTEDRIVEKIRVLSQLNKPLIVAGCLPKINFKAVLKAAPDLSAVLDPRSVDKILLAVKSAERGEKSKIFFSQKPVHKLRQPKIRLNPSVEIISISEGCVGACAFCCVRFARGALFSYPKEDIVKRVSHAVSEGVKEFWLTSQDNGAYGLDIKTNLAELLEDCCRVEGKFLIRVGMMNPDHVPWKLPELIDAYKNEKIFKFLHLPVQSGDNETLTRMNRRYTVEEFKKIVHKFREKIPETTLSTDIICGFPGESRQAFEETLKLVEEVQPDIVNISKFFSRPHTPAGLMEPIDANEVKDRSRRLTKIARKTSLDRNRTWLNWEGQVFIDEKGRDSSWIGRNFAYKPIAIRSNEYLSGRFIQAKVVEVHPTYLEAEVAENL
jgi:MiaB-like tRNA modifying enzyme